MTQSSQEPKPWQASAERVGSPADELGVAQEKRLLTVPELPTDRPRLPIQSFRGATCSVEFPVELASRLDVVGRQEGATLAATLFAAFAALLYRHTAQTDVLIASSAASRMHAEIEPSTRFPASTPIARARLDGDPTFREVLQRIRGSTMTAHTHQDVSSTQPVDGFQPDPEQSREPWAQVSFEFQDVSRRAPQVAGIPSTRVEVAREVAAIDLALMIFAGPDSLSAQFEYNAELFDAATIERLLDHFRTLLAGIAADPDQPISGLPLLTAAESHQVLVEWNTTATDFPADRRIDQLIEAQARARPDAIAVTFDGRVLTYAELNRRANQLAHYLLRRGVGPEMLIGLAAERSLEMIVGILGILKAGGVYFPIDPTYPPDRIAFMMSDARAHLVLTQASLVDRLQGPNRHFVLLDADWPDVAQESDTTPDVAAAPDQLAYVIYTSGSTGRPKGVMIEHRGLCNLAEAQRRLFDVRPESRVLQFSTLSFDASVWEIVMALHGGARLCLARPSTLMSGPDLVRFMRDERVTHATLPPSMLAVMPVEPLPDLTALIVAGEACPVELVERWSAGRSLFNAYGPTETTVCASVYRYQPDRPGLPIGRPLPNMHLFVLDSNLQPVPVGVPGELYVGGMGLARGYLHRPDLTRERFIPNPFLEALSTFNLDPSPRLYQTGDRARYRSDGNIDFLGRIDDQVKVRGFRIEPSEIESVLRRHPGVRDAVVVAREIGPQLSDKQLVAYTVAAQEPVPSAEVLRDYLRQSLPDYMIPALFVVLEALPLSPNGKVDRRALPAPGLSRLDRRSTYVAPRTPVEQALAGMWSEVLGVQAPGVNDDFFELGGHSLKAIQVLSRVRDRFQIDLPLRRFFDAPTIAGLAGQLDTPRGAASWATIPRRADSSRAPLSYSQQRLWLLEQLQPGITAYNLPAIFHLSGRLDIQALERSLHAVVERHATLRTTFASTDDQPVQVIALPPKGTAMPIVDLRGHSASSRDGEARRRALDEIGRPFDLARGPLWRACLLQVSDTEHYLVMAVHHSIADGWSFGILFRELSALYQAFVSGQSSPLAELPVQYADFAAWQRVWLRGDVLQDQLAYWKRHLDGAPPILNLATDFPRPVVQTFRGERQSVSVPPALTDALTSLGRREGATLFMTLLAAFETLLYHCTGQNDFVIGTPAANRNRAALEGLIGFFLNSLALRADLSGDPSFRVLLRRTREAALGAYAHQDLPFELLLEALQPARDLSRTPLFQVMFNLLNYADESISLPGLSVETIEPPELGAKFDLELYAKEERGGVRLTLVYNADLFLPATAGQMLEHFTTLLDAIASDPDRRVSHLPLITKRQRDQLVAQHRANFPSNPFQEFLPADIEQSISSRFEQQVRQYPERLAVKTRRLAWTYRELNEAANRIAHAVASRLGREPEQVALLFEHEAQMIAAMLGVLKAGKAYVPLDVTTPRDRLAYMLADAQVSAILTNGANRALAEELARVGPPYINVDALDWATPSVELEAPVAPETMAYLLYTSGSTGLPKGVAQNHRNVLHFVRAYTNNLHICADDRLTLFSSYSFDAAVMDVFGALLNGAALYPFAVRDESPRDLIDALKAAAITIYHSTPTLYRYLIGSLSPDETLSDARLVVLGGEEVFRRDVELYREHFPPTSVFVNGLGPTESTVSLQNFITHRTAIRQNSVPVGYPVDGTDALLLDDWGAENGVYGEIAICSPHVALGYWQAPDLTRERFLPDPAGGDRRMYRTGDLGRRRPDGMLEFVGRKDFQVKIRGYRVELPEIEAALSKHASVRECVVVAKEDKRGEKRLVAYVVPASEDVATSELQRFLKEKLPDYMLPTAYVTLGKLPTTPGGKVDRRAMPEPDSAQMEFGLAFVAPRTAVEHTLAGIWASVLQRASIGVDDNFFDLGGHSLLAMQVVSRIRSALHVELPLRAIFEAPTVAGLASKIGDLPTANTELAAHTIQPVDRAAYRRKRSAP